MARVIMNAADTLHITAVQADAIRASDKFEVDTRAADSLKERGLTTRLTAPAEMLTKAK
jgi:hypothetical protein